MGDTKKLWKHIEPHLKKALTTLYLREVSSSQWERYQELTETSDNPALQGKPWPPCTCGRCPVLNGSATRSWQRPGITPHCKVRKPWPPCTCGKCPVLNGSATRSSQRPVITLHCKVRKPWPPCTCGRCPALNGSATRSWLRPVITLHCKVSPDHPVPAGSVQLSMGALPGADRDQR